MWLGKIKERAVFDTLPGLPLGGAALSREQPMQRPRHAFIE